jgi:hypothetical protein
MPSIVKKLDIRQGDRIIIINAPPPLLHEMHKVEGLEWKEDGEADYIHIFVTEQSTLQEMIPMYLNCLAEKGKFWVSWPKLSARIPGDLNREIVREIMLQTGLVDTKVCAVDETWSALKFMHRRVKK